jgi:hypothetical protein
MAATAAPAATLRWDQVGAWRAARHHLDGRVRAAAMLDVAGRIAGVHAQVMSSAELTLWARVEVEGAAAYALAADLPGWPGPAGAEARAGARPRGRAVSSSCAGRTASRAWAWP